MSGLLDFALGFGAGAAGAVAQDRSQQLQMQRQANLDRLRMQYQREVQQEEYSEIAGLVGGARQGDIASQDMLTARGVNWRPAGASSQTQIAKLHDDLEAAIAAGDTERAAAIRAVINSTITSSDEATTASRTFEDNVRRLMETNPGWSRETAVRILSNLDRVHTDPETGRVIVTGPDETGQITARNVPVDRGESERVFGMPSPSRIEDLRIDASKGVGIRAVASSLYNSTLGQLPMLPIADDVERAAIELESVSRDLVMAFSISSRPPVIEQERIMRLSPNALDWAENPRVAQLKLSSLVDIMAIQYQADLIALDDPGLPRQDRANLSRRTRQIENLINRIITPEAAERLFSEIEGTDFVEQAEEAFSNHIEALYAIDNAAAGGIPVVPPSMIPDNVTDKQFDALLDLLGVKEGMEFTVPGSGTFIR